jgi:MoaA/NifB/PqqE/SkfB family radical SAM enzyme
MFLKRILIKNGFPIHLIWFVTARCNLSCSHCFYHDQISFTKQELTIDEIKAVIESLSPLLSLSLTGGEPFLREDLPDIAELIYLKRLTENLLLYTNGFNTNSILLNTEKILTRCPGLNISINVSIDGFEKEHDQYRNKIGAYAKTITTIKELQRLKRKFPNFQVFVNTTLQKENQHYINELRRDIFSRLGINSGFTIIRGNPLNPALLDVEAEIYKSIIKTIQAEMQCSHRISLIQKIVNTRIRLGNELAYNTYISKRRTYDCYAGSLMGVIHETGDVRPCEMLDDSLMGNLRDYDYKIGNIWKSIKAEEIRKRIKTKRCFCTYECQYTCNTLYNIKYLPIFIKDMIL